MELKNIKLIRPLKWEEVFLFWYQSEGTSENWMNLAKQRGFASWAEWRLTGYALPFECAKAEWGIYELSYPTQVFPNFYGGPFRAWIKRHYGGAKEKTFIELAKQPDIYENPTIKSMVKNFPTDKIITLLKVKNKIFVIEGMHRSCALVVMNERNLQAPAKVLIALGKSKLNELPIVGRNTRNQLSD